ncbi:MAG: MFS transporter [Candidatus Thorarchaeota archaeon]
MCDENFLKDSDVVSGNALDADPGNSVEIVEKPKFSLFDREQKSQLSVETQKEIKRRTKLFYLISAGNATGQTFLFNFFSAFAVLVGVGSELLGFITSIRNLMSSLFQGTIGRMSDKLGRKYFLLLGFFFVFSSIVVLIFINNPVMLIVISIIQAFSLSIIIPVWNATLGDVTSMDQRAGYIGKLSALGTILSVTLMLILATIFYLADEVLLGKTILGWIVFIPDKTQYSIAFGLAAFNFLLCLLGAFLLKETRIIKEKKQQPRMFIALKNKDFRKFFIINSIFGLTMAIMWPLFPIAQVTILEMKFAEIAIVNAIFSTCSSLAQYFGGKLSDRIGRKPLIVFGRMGMFVIPLIMIGAILIDNWLLLIISNVIGGAAMGAMTVSMNAYILDLAPEAQMGAYTGLTQVGWGITTFVGSLSAGFIAQPIEAVIGTKMMIVYTFAVISVLRLITSFAFFFINESFTLKDRKLLSERRKAKLDEKYSYDYCYEYTVDDSSIRIK